MCKGREIANPSPPINDPDHIHIKALPGASVYKREMGVLELKRRTIRRLHVGYGEGAVRRRDTDLLAFLRELVLPLPMPDRLTLRPFITVCRSVRPMVNSLLTALCCHRQTTPLTDPFQSRLGFTAMSVNKCVFHSDFLAQGRAVLHSRAQKRGVWGVLRFHNCRVRPLEFLGQICRLRVVNTKPLA